VGSIELLTAFDGDAFNVIPSDSTISARSRLYGARSNDDGLDLPGRDHPEL